MINAHDIFATFGGDPHSGMSHCPANDLTTTEMRQRKNDAKRSCAVFRKNGMAHAR